MDRHLIIALTLFSVVFMVQSLSQEDIDARNKCLKEHGFTIEPKYVSAYKTIDIRAKCYASCLMRETGVVKEDGSIDLNKVLEKISDSENKTLDEVVKKSFIPCTEKKGDNDCDTGHQILTCIVATISILKESMKIV
ncbi:uncharacterized protein LOC100680258 [Nasonia vitripennis]|uniref:Putative odorant binding protein 10 n=1 Tax=Nasonia vitripennis TaxID=7425 RepID=G8B1L5_NASVI|nr:uncharacterized protein LOC100680258 [Nasonia vitripennis]XP_031786279.1 uncharacterized protein LOC100680258 [Nasonia vitripennis]CCD17779.1 putative odorant binding protein 10 [Nasonia vitripennis]